jgi:hypothetical protein
MNVDALSLNHILGVDTLQIPVPGGDCAIILLVDKPPMRKRKDGEPNVSYHKSGHQPENTEDGKRGTVLRAILVDGGHDARGPGYHGREAYTKIWNTLQGIESNYNIANYPGHEGLKFDAWIVTHWDRDHYCGALQLFWSTLRVNEAGVLDSPFVRYDDNGNALTTLYCPTWTGYQVPGSTKFARGHHSFLDSETDVDGVTRWRIRLPPPNGSKGLLSYTKAEYVKMPFSGFFGTVVEKSPQLLGLDFFTGCRFQGDTPVYGEDQAGYRIHGVCEAFREGYTSNSPTYGLPTYGLDPDDKWDAKYPVLLCVGAEGNVMGCARKNITHATGDNYVSIMMLLIWLPRKTGAWHVSLFAGGDAHMETENQVVDFLEGCTVEVIKAGHHGARTSTSARLLKRLQPNKFIVSAGHEHGHPSKCLSVSWPIE